MNALNETSVSAFCQFNLTDEELICEYRRTGDDRFFEELAARYRTRLPRYLDARYKLTNAQLEDAVQSTFATVYRKLDQYDASRSFRPWFYRVATTRTLDLLRAQKRADKFFSLDAPSRDDGSEAFADSVEGREPDPSVELERRETRAEVRRAIAKLPSKFRQVLEMVFFQGLTRQSVAAALRTTVSTVSRRISRALQKLRYYLQNERLDSQSARLDRVLQGARVL